MTSHENFRYILRPKWHQLQKMERQILPLWIEPSSLIRLGFDSQLEALEFHFSQLVLVGLKMYIFLTLEFTLLEKIYAMFWQRV